MLLVDSHCHLNRLADREHDLSGVLEEARRRGVGHLLSVATELGELDPLLEIRGRYPGISISCGVHPLQITQGYTPEALEDQISRPEVVALGETGLDYLQQDGDRERQREVFRDHLHLGRKHGKPLIVHMRHSSRDLLSILEEHRGGVQGVVHCFAGDAETARSLLDLGFYVSFSGIVTFPGAEGVREVARYVPLDRMLLETDAPYLSPVPFRGERNQPANVREVANLIVRLRGISLALLSEVTTRNFSQLFGVEIDPRNVRAADQADAALRSDLER